MKTMFGRSSRDGRRSATATRNSLRRGSSWTVELFKSSRRTHSKRTIAVATLKDARAVVREFAGA